MKFRLKSSQRSRSDLVEKFELLFRRLTPLRDVCNLDCDFPDPIGTQNETRDPDAQPEVVGALICARRENNLSIENA